MCFVNFATRRSCLLRNSSPVVPRYLGSRGVEHKTHARLAFRACVHARKYCLSKAAPQVAQLMHDAMEGELHRYIRAGRAFTFACALTTPLHHSLLDRLDVTIIVWLLL